MAYIALTLLDELPKSWDGQGTVTELNDRDLQLSVEEFTQRITMPMTALILERFAPHKPVH